MSREVGLKAGLEVTQGMLLAPNTVIPGVEDDIENADVFLADRCHKK